MPDPERPGSGEPAGSDLEQVDSGIAPGFFGERFAIGGALGSGAMGKVVQALDRETGIEVALKVLHRERAKDAESIERFQREAAILESIGHPGIVRVVAMSRAPDGTPFLAMELLRGETVEERLARGPIAPLDMVPIVNTLCDALAAAHLRGIVHRDLKPANVILLSSGDPPCKILDFGLSRFTASKTLTRTGTILGTPRYMAPELIRSVQSSDYRVDVFSVGVLIYEMLTGRSPYPADDVGALLGCVVQGRVVPLADVRPDLPAALGAVITRAMAREPDERFETAGAIAEAFANALGIASGRSQLDASSGVDELPFEESGSEPLIDPFAGGAVPSPSRPSSERPPALDATVSTGELAAHPLLGTLPPGLRAEALALEVQQLGEQLAQAGAPSDGGAAAAAGRRPSGAHPPAARSAVPLSGVAPPASPSSAGAHSPVAQPGAAVGAGPAGGIASPSASPREASRSSWPSSAPAREFTRPRIITDPNGMVAPFGTQRRSDRPVAAAALRRKRMIGCGIFAAALFVVASLAAIVGVALRAYLHGRVHVPGVGQSLESDRHP
jgi:serine/threonine protein kinase